MSRNGTATPMGNDVYEGTFRLECYGPNDSKVMRYYNGCTLKELEVRDYFTARALATTNNENDLETALERGNNENWHIPASTLCMASSIWTQKSVPVEWDEAKKYHMNSSQVFSKARALLDCLHSSKRLNLNHTVTAHEINNNVVKYAIKGRNTRLVDCASKSRKLSKIISQSIGLQTNFLRVLSEIKKQFKVLLNIRNLVDVSSFDVDYPSTFSVFVIFYDMDLNLNQESEPQVWESWDLHKLVHPGRPQQCLVSYYEDDNPEAGLLTKMTFPTQVSYFIERNFALTVNGAHVPVYTKDGCNPVIYRLRNAQMCLIDRFIFIAISQAALEPLRSQTPIIVEGVHVFVKSMTSERLTIVFEGEMLELGYISFGNEEVGDVVWRLVITKLRDLTIEYWKRQVYQRDRHELCLLTSFLKYTVKLFTKFVLT